MPSTFNLCMFHRIVIALNDSERAYTVVFSSGL